MARKRSDSAAHAVESTQAVLAGPIKPPEHVKLRACDMPFWNAIVNARAATTWNKADLALAANLARCLADVEKYQKQLDREKPVVMNAQGTPKANPLFAIIEQLSRRAVAISRVVHVHAEATVGRAREAGNKLHVQQEAEASVSAVRDSEAGSFISGLDTLQ